MKFDKDPDDLHGDDVTVYLMLAIRRNGAMSVEGCIGSEALALAMLDTARETIQRYNRRFESHAGAALIIPHKDTALQ